MKSIGMGRASWIVRGTVLAAAPLMALSAPVQAASYTDTVTGLSWTPSPNGTTEQFGGLINFNRAVPLSTPGMTGSVTPSGNTVGPFTFDYGFTLSSDASLVAILQQTNTDVGPGSEGPGTFELFSGTPSPLTLLASSVLGTGVNTGELVLSYAGLTSGTHYTLQIAGQLLSGKVGTLGGLADFTQVTHVSPIPLPAAALLFGSGLVGLVAAKRRSRKTA